MYNVSDTFLSDISKYGRQFDTEILINGQEQPITIYDINVFKHRFNASMFSSVMRTLEIDSSANILKNSIITGKLGIKFDEDDFEYINYNNYKVLENSKYNEDTKAYITLAYDKMCEAMIPYDLEMSFPISVRNFVILICNRLNWNTSNVSSSFINSETLIAEDIFSNIDYTFRDVLDEIAKITCSFPCFGLDGLFTLKYITETGKTINNDYLSQDSLEFTKMYYINSLVFTRAENSDIIFRKDNEDIAINGLHEYKLSDLQILSTDNRSSFIDAMFAYLRTLNFWIYDVKSTGVFAFDIADRFTISFENTNYSVVALNSEGTVEQGLAEQMYCDEPGETETDYISSTNEKKKDIQTKIILDKQNKKITQLVQETTEQGEKLTQVETSVNGVTQTVSETTTKLNNDYLTAEQIEAENDTIKNDINIIKEQQTTVATTAQGLQVQINSINNEGVKVVKNTTVDINEEGVSVGKADSEFSTTMSNTGTYMKSYGKTIAKYDKDGTETGNFKATGEVEMGYLKLIKGTTGTEPRTHVHFIG